MFQYPNQNKVLARHTEFAESELAETTKRTCRKCGGETKRVIAYGDGLVHFTCVHCGLLAKPDGRRNNGSKPGEARKKKYADVGKPTRKKVCYYLSPKHVAAIEARGKGMTATVAEALDLLFAIENGQK